MSEDKVLSLRTRNKLPRDQYGDVLDRAEKGDRSVLPQVRQLLDEFPSMVEELGDLNQLARSAMLDRLDGKSLLIREAEERKLASLAEAITGPHPTILEKLLADQIVLCWQHVRYVEIRYGQARNYTFTEGDYYQRSLDRAQKRYLKAIKALAHMRKLRLPPVQVNIATKGGKQINVAE